MSVKHITQNEFQEEVMDNKGLVLVDFYADWCGPCKMLAPILEEVGETLPELKIVKVNVDENQNLAQQYGVMSIPTVYLFDGGMNAGKFVGVKSKEEIIDFVQNS